jgi:hypothetical protein
MAQLKAGTTIGGVEPILKDVLHAHTIMVANADHTPIELTVAEGRLIGRKTGGNIDDLTGQEAADIVSAYLATPITPQTVASAFTDAHGFPDFLYNGQEDFAPVKVPTGDAIASGYYGSQYPYLAIDGSDSTFWGSAESGAGCNGVSWIGVKNLKRNIKAIKYLNHANTADTVTSVKVDYSTDGGVTWTNIQTTTVVNTGSAWNEFVVAAYAGGDAGLHAIRLLANSATGSAYWVIYTLILLYNSNLDVCTTANAVSYDGASPANAFDNVASTYYQSVANMNGGLTYLGQSGLASAVKAVRYYQNSSGTTPKEIRLSWKQNVGDAWTDLATVACDVTGGIWQTFSVPSYSPSGSHYFALRPTTNCAANVFGVYELEFYLGDDTDISMTASATDPLQLVHSSGKTNYITEVTTADTTLLGASLVPGRTGFIYADRNASTGAITYGSKPIVPQYGQEFDATKHCLLHFEGADASTVITDEFGSTWVANGGACLDDGGTGFEPKFGSTFLLLDGNGDSIKNTDRYWFNGQPFTIEGWWYTANHATANQEIVGMPNANTWPIHITYSHDSLSMALSSNNASWDIMSAIYTFTAADNTWYKFIIEWDGYYYRGWWGTSTATMVLAANVKSSTPINTTNAGLEFGAYNSGATNPTNGGMDEIRITLNSNRYGWSPVAEVAAFDKYDSDMTYFDIQKMKMYYGGGTSWTEVQRLFLGEAYMDAHGVTDMRNYALKGRYRSADTTIPGAGVRTAFSGNLGVVPTINPSVFLRNYITQAAYIPGQMTKAIVYGDANAVGTEPGVAESRNILSATVGGTSTGMGVINRTSGALTAITAANWKMNIQAQRGW